MEERFRSEVFTAAEDGRAPRAPLLIAVDVIVVVNVLFVVKGLTY